jgi:hypothetical protein
VTRYADGAVMVKQGDNLAHVSARQLASFGTASRNRKERPELDDRFHDSNRPPPGRKSAWDAARQGSAGMRPI